MDVALLITAAVLALLLVGTLLVVRRDRARMRRELAVARVQAEELRARLETYERDLSELTRTVTENHSSYLITDAGLEKAQDRAQPNVPDRLVLSATLGEPLVKVVSLGHGVARALSAESRNRIWFEMRREVRRARKQRRREMKEAWRQMRAEERSAA